MLPAAVLPGGFVSLGWDFDKSGFAFIYFEIAGLEISKKNEIHGSLLRYQGNLPCGHEFQKVVKSIEFSYFSVHNMAFRLGKNDIL